MARNRPKLVQHRAWTSDIEPGPLYPNQILAITNLEHSLRQDKPRALVQMATGSGKTLTSVAEIYRLIKFGGARRVLFLVDRSNLGEQAEKEYPRRPVATLGLPKVQRAVSVENGR